MGPKWLQSATVTQQKCFLLITWLFQPWTANTCLEYFWRSSSNQDCILNTKEKSRLKPDWYQSMTSSSPLHSPEQYSMPWTTTLREVSANTESRQQLARPHGLKPGGYLPFPNPGILRNCVARTRHLGMLLVHCWDICSKIINIQTTHIHIHRHVNRIVWHFWFKVTRTRSLPDSKMSKYT